MITLFSNFLIFDSSLLLETIKQQLFDLFV